MLNFHEFFFNVHHITTHFGDVTIYYRHFNVYADTSIQYHKSD